MSAPRWLYDPGTSYGKKLPKLTKMLNTLDGNSKAKLRKQLLETLSLGFDFKAIFQKFYPSEKESTVEPKKASELEKELKIS